MWLLAFPRPPRPASFEIAVWYWRHPFRLSPRDRQRLAGERIRRIFVHAGTLVPRENRPQVRELQNWELGAESGSWEIDATLRVHPAANEWLLHSDHAARVAAQIRQAVPRSVRGVQLDADIPTARLADYARFLAALRRELPAGTRLGVTALPDWLRSTGYDTLCRSVDEIAPQFYGNRWPESGKAPPPLWETEGLVAAARRAAVGPARVWVGLPAYGRCIVIDPEGRPRGVRHDLSPEPILEDSTWSASASTRKSRFGERGAPDSMVEDQLALHAVLDTEAGPLEAPEGTTLWFQWPRVTGLRAAVAAIRELQLPSIAGVALFRWPAPEEPLAVPLRLEGPPPAARLSVQAETRGRLTRVVVTNQGEAAPLLTAPVRVELQAEGGIPVDVTPGDSADHRTGSVRRERAYLPPGSRWTACELRDARGPIRMRVTWMDAEGVTQETRSKIPGKEGGRR